MAALAMIIAMTLVIGVVIVFSIAVTVGIAWVISKFAILPLFEAIWDITLPLEPVVVGVTFFLLFVSSVTNALTSQRKSTPLSP